MGGYSKRDEQPAGAAARNVGAGADGRLRARAALDHALAGLGWVLRNRLVVTPPVEAALRRLGAPAVPRPHWTVMLVRRLAASRRPTAI